MKKVLILLAFFFILAKPALASDSSVYVQSINSGTSSNWSGGASAITGAPDSVSSSYSPAGTGILYWTFTPTSLPASATVDSITISFTGSGTGDFGLRITNSTPTDQCGGYEVAPNGSKTITTGDCPYLTASILNSGLYARVSSWSGNQTWSVDAITLTAHYTWSAMAISSATVSGQLVYLNLTGDTATGASNMACRIDIMERCSASGKAGWTSSTPVSHIYLDPSYTAPTSNLGGGYFTGYGWGTPHTDTTWQADGVEVPYNQGYSCDYPMSQICYDKTSREVLNESDWTTNPIMVATPSAGLTSSSLTEPEPTNPLAWVVWKLQQIFWSIFGLPNDTVDQIMFAELDSNLKSKAPIAYVYTALTADYSSPTSSTSSPTITIPVVGTVSISSNDSGGQLALLAGYIRNGITLALWILFLGYILTIPAKMLGRGNS